MGPAPCEAYLHFSAAASHRCLVDSQASHLESLNSSL
jgi:hypothetical protein